MGEEGKGLASRRPTGLSYSRCQVPLLKSESAAHRTRTPGEPRLDADGEADAGGGAGGGTEMQVQMQLWIQMEMMQIHTEIQVQGKGRCPCVPFTFLVPSFSCQPVTSPSVFPGSHNSSTSAAPCPLPTSVLSPCHVSLPPCSLPSLHSPHSSGF